jgi:DNA repair protein RadC
MEQLMNENEWYQIAEVELVYKTSVKPSHRPVLKDSKIVYELLLQTWDKNKIQLQEQFKVLLLNRANRLLGILDAFSGGISGTVVDPRLIFSAAIKANACGIMLAHNHPSGNLQPSRTDEELTQKIKHGGKLLDIGVLDHLIICEEGYFSFADEGLL